MLLFEHPWAYSSARAISPASFCMRRTRECGSMSSPTHSVSSTTTRNPFHSLGSHHSQYCRIVGLQRPCVSGAQTGIVCWTLNPLRQYVVALLGTTIVYTSICLGPKMLHHQASPATIIHTTGIGMQIHIQHAIMCSLPQIAHNQCHHDWS